MSIKKFLLLFISYEPTLIWAQASYMHEAQEDSGNPIAGILGLLLLGGIVYIIINFRNFFNHNQYSSKKEDDLVIQSKQDIKGNNPVNDFNKHCINVYGNYVEIVGDYLLLNEDGNYCMIDNKDKRYNPLYSYIKNHYLNRVFLSWEVINIELLNLYIDYCLKEGKLCYAKPIEKYGFIKEDFHGGRIVALKMYYDVDFEWFRGHYISKYPHRNKSLFEYVNAIGYDLAILLHKKMNTPIDLQTYKDFKDMQSLGMTVYEYKKYCDLYKGKIVQKEGKFYDALGNFIGNSFSEASNYWDTKFLSFEKAKKEIDNISWHL